MTFQESLELIIGFSHKAIAAYLVHSGHSKTIEAFREETERGQELITDETCTKYVGLLEKKWTSVVRLQKKVVFGFLIETI